MSYILCVNYFLWQTNVKEIVHGWLEFNYQTFKACHIIVGVLVFKVKCPIFHFDVSNTKYNFNGVSILINPKVIGLYFLAISIDLAHNSMWIRILLMGKLLNFIKDISWSERTLMCCVSARNLHIYWKTSYWHTICLSLKSCQCTTLMYRMHEREV